MIMPGLPASRCYLTRDLMVSNVVSDDPVRTVVSLPNVGDQIPNAGRPPDTGTPAMLVSSAAAALLKAVSAVPMTPPDVDIADCPRFPKYVRPR